MKQYGFTGKGTGKLGSSVFAISGGEQIVRQYNPIVSNPQTEAQTEQRTKFKLLTQLAAAMSGQIAFRKSGMTSARNKFVSANSKSVAFAEGVATKYLTDITLTGGSVSIPDLQVDRDSATSLSVQLNSAAGSNVARVVYVVYRTTADNKLQLVEEKTISEAGVNRNFATTFTVPNEDVVIYAYGIIDNNARAKAAFEDYQANAGENESTLEVLKSLSVSDYTLTETVSALSSKQG